MSCVNVGVGEGVDVAKGGDLREWVRVWVWVIYV